MSSPHSGAIGSLGGRLLALFGALPMRRRLQIVPLVMLMLISSVAELITIGAVVPFLAVLIQPGQTLQFEWLQQIIATLGVADATGQPLFFAVVFIFLASLSMLLRLALTYATRRWALMANHDLMTDLYHRMLSQPFIFHCKHNSSELISALFKVTNVTNSVIQPALQALVSAAVSLGIVAALIVIDPLVALSAGMLFTFVYMLISILVRARLRRGGKQIARTHTARLKILQEGLTSIREVILDGREASMLEQFSALEKSLLKAQAEAQIIAATPRYLVETFGIVVLVGLAIMLTGRGEPETALPVIGALALAAQRLLPQAQQLYGSWVSITGHRQIVDDVLEFRALSSRDLHQCGPVVPGFGFRKELRFERVSFRYPGASKPVLREVDLRIPRGGWISIVGETGAGKSTLLDLLLGLLEPTEGKILVDGTVLDTAHRRAWQDRLAHVPQTLFLADASIGENIALGTPKQSIDFERVREAATLAGLDEFLESRPGGLESRVGERGNVLSGGQRQRIGIARALYRNPEVLILDEATNALDPATEQSVLGNLERVRANLTVIMVTHRPSAALAGGVTIRVQDGRVMIEQPLDGRAAG